MGERMAGQENAKAKIICYLFWDEIKILKQSLWKQHGKKKKKIHVNMKGYV